MKIWKENDREFALEELQKELSKVQTVMKTDIIKSIASRIFYMKKTREQKTEGDETAILILDAVGYNIARYSRISKKRFHSMRCQIKKIISSLRLYHERRKLTISGWI